MSGKQDKKIRKLFRKEYAERARLMADHDINLLNSRIFRPKPKYFPMRLWLWLMSFFIKIKKK